MMGDAVFSGVIIAIAVGFVVWCFYLIGHYDFTGETGWLRVPAGAWLFWLLLQLDVKRWIVRRCR